MRKEWNGLLVGKDEYEEKHPQLEPFGKVSDPEAIRNARPETNLVNQRSFQYGFNPVGFKPIPGLIEGNDLVATGQVGTVTLFFPKTLGSEATGEVGDVTVILPASVTVAVSGFASLSGSVGSVSVEEGIVVSVTGSSSTSAVGSVTVLTANVIAAPTGIAATSSVGSVTVASNVTLTFPADDGNADEFLKTNGSGVLSFAAVSGGTSWQAVKTSTFTAVAGEGYFINTTGGAFEMDLPAGSIGDEVSFIDYAGTFDSNALTIDQNGTEKIAGSTDPLTVSTERAANTLVYVDGTQGWLLKNN